MPYNDNENRPSAARSPKTDYGTGKTPPHNDELEQAVLGAIMLDRDAFAVVLDILKPQSFYKIAHQNIFEAMMQLFAKSAPIDLLTVVDALRKASKLDQTGGASYIVELTNRVASSANIEYHARIISQKFIQRELIRTCSDTITEAFADTTDVFDLMDKAEQNLFAITETNISRAFQGMGQLSANALRQIEAAAKMPDGLTGVNTGFAGLNKLTAGLQPSDLIIVAARPAMGKTAFVLSLAKNAAENGNGVAFFSLEMSSVQLMLRLIANDSDIASDLLRTGKMSPAQWIELQSALERLQKLPIFIDDTPGISIFELRAKCRRLKAQNDIKLVVVDYLQLMTNSGGEARNGNREQEISAISRGLKGLAKELNVPVIALSQLSRAVETRGGAKRPMLSDLRESGAIEQDADIVAFLYRPEYYDITEDENGNSNKGVCEVIVAKHRNGALDDIRLNFIGALSRFEDRKLDDFAAVLNGSGYEIPLPQPTQFPQIRGNDTDVPF